MASRFGLRLRVEGNPNGFRETKTAKRSGKTPRGVGQAKVHGLLGPGHGLAGGQRWGAWLPPRAWLACLLAVWGLLGCSALSDDLERARLLYKEAHYEAGTEWLVELESMTGTMTSVQRASFYYLRGMTAYRLGQRQDALHYLALAAELQRRDAELVRRQWRPVLARTLAELTPTGATHHARNPVKPSAL